MAAPTVIFVDMLNDFVQAWLAAARDRLVASTNAVLVIVRHHALGVIRIRQEFQSDLSDGFAEAKKKDIGTAIAGTAGCQIVSDLNEAPPRTGIVNKRYSALFGTALERMLDRLAPDGLIFPGSLHMPVSASRRSAPAGGTGTLTSHPTVSILVIVSITKSRFAASMQESRP